MTHTPSNYAQTVLADGQMSTAVDISKLQTIALQQLEKIKHMERDAALRAILVGFTLFRIKRGVKHGEFRPWIDKHFEGGGKSLANYYMRLAIAAVEKTKATKPELLALPGDQTELAIEAADVKGRQLMDKLTKFVGDRSLNELLSDLGIKDRKAPHKHAAGGDDEGEKPPEAKHAQTVQEAWNAIADSLRAARGSACDKAVWMSFTRVQHEDLLGLFDHAAENIRKIFVKTHGRNKS